MAIVTKPYTDFVNNVDVADAAKVNAQINTLYTLVNGNLDGSNVKAGTVDALTVLTHTIGGSVGQIPLNENIATQADATYYVNVTTGNDSNAGTSAGAPFKTIQAAINKLSQTVNHNIVINVAAGDYSAYPPINILGFTGKGSITINGGAAVGDSYLTPQVVITSCYVTISITGIRAVNAGENFTVKNSSDVTFNYCKADNVSTTADGFAIYSSRVTIANSLINNKRSGIGATARSIVYSQNNTGGTNTYGLLCAEASKIGKNGTQPAGTTAENVFNGGQIL